MAELLSIPLWCDCNLQPPRSAECNPTTFNPTMVRLQPRLVEERYQGTMSTFNPTMVRLQPAPPNPTTHLMRAFQSHYGAIATSLSTQPAQCRTYFQSHYGAIATVSIAYDDACGCVLSIPLWCDCNPNIPFAIFVLHFLSIPLWCDCNENGAHWWKESTVAFNPTMVRLQLSGPRLPQISSPTFNPTMVRLQPSYRFTSQPTR